MIRKRRVERRQVVGQRRARPTKAHLQTAHLRNPPLDRTSPEYYECIGRKSYLTVREFADHGSFPTENAAYVFLQRHPDVKRTVGRKVLVNRRAFDLFVERSAERHA